MSVKRYFAVTAREALRQIRKELGESAVILSNRKVEGGIEIMALADADIAQMTGPHKAVEPVAAKVVEAPHKAVATKTTPTVQAGHQDILGEIKSMHSMLQQQLCTMSWNDAQQRDPQRASLMRRMLNAGFSTHLAKQLMDKMPNGNTAGEAWIKQVLKRNLHIAGSEEDIVVQGGVYALIGPTGVGKTTTTAKLAARAVVRYGADKIALLTTDTYRIGAYEQLKIYGKILNVAVLIDTVGMGQRDERVANQNEMFDATGVRRLLMLNATSSGDTLEDVVRMYHSEKVIGCIATKLDEAVNLGAVLDVAVRHKLVMHYMANGQRVPEDLHPINLDYLLHRAIKPVEQATAFTRSELEFPLLMAAEGSAHSAGAHTGVLLAGAAEGSAQASGVSYA
jgi:flagellar biosynthesis protein FlhF